MFQANIFHPHRDTLAYSEHIVGPALLAAPARLFTTNPVAVQNVSLLSSFVLLGLACFLFFRWICRDSIAAACGGVLAALAPVRFGQLGHIQLLHTAGFPLLLYGLWSWNERRRPAAGLLVAASLVFLTLSSFYLGAMALMTVVLFALAAPVAFGLRRAANSALRLSPWIVGACAATIPFAIPYWRLARDFGFVRELGPNWINWASHKDYIQPLLGSLAGRLLPEYATPRGRCLYLGLLTSLLAVAGLLLARSSRRRPGSRERTAVVVLGTLGIGMFLISLGGWRSFGESRLLLPFYFLHKLPGFSGIRAPIRFGVVTDIAVVGLATVGLACLRRTLSLRLGAAAAGVLALAAGGLAIAERIPPLPVTPIETVEVGEEIPHVYRLLAAEPRPVRILELPMTTTRLERESWDVIPYKQVYFSTVHWKRMLNGSSGYKPPGFDELVATADRFPADETMEDLRRLPIDWIVVRRRLLSSAVSESLFRREGFRVLHACAEDVIAEVRTHRAPRQDALAPRVSVLAKPSAGVPLRFSLSWDPSLPRLLYPPPRVEIAAETRDADGDRHRTRRLLWPAEPRRLRTYTVIAPPSARSLTLEIRTEKKTMAMRWELPRSNGGRS